MARLTQDTRDKILADFHTGYFSIRQLADKYETSHTTVNKLTKGVEPKHKAKVDTIVSIQSDLAEESFQEVYSVNQVIEERTKHLIFFQNAAIKNQVLANKGIDNINALIKEEEKNNNGKSVLATSCMSIVKDHATITKTNKETVLGRDPDTAIQINNQNNQNNELEWQLEA